MQRFLRPIVGVLLVFAGMSSIESCENIHENSNDDIENHQDYLVFQNRMFSVYELIEEIADQTTAQGLPERWKSPLLPKGLKFIKQDSTYLDGDGVEFEVDFGDWEANVLSPPPADGIFKAGILKIKIDKFYQEIGSKMKVEFGGSSDFKMGIVNFPFSWDGELNFNRTDANLVNISSTGISMLDGSVDRKASFNLDFLKIDGFGTPGIFEDTYKVDGSFNAMMNNDEHIEVQINTSLMKRVEWGCSSSPLKGILFIKGDKDGTQNGVTVDYDPFNNEACDDWVRLQFAGKTKDFKIPMNP